MGATITQHQPGSFTVEMDFDGAVPSANWSQEYLLISDAHIDNAHADRSMFERHMRQCRERGAQWISNGDFLCLMQGSWDFRKDTSACRPEHRDGRYLDAVINTTADYVSPHADMALLFAPGNHENSVKKRHDTDMNERLVEALKVRNKDCHAYAGSYANWVRFLVRNKERRQIIGNSIVMYMHHGYGGGGPVTRGTIQTSRMAVYLPDADIVWTGHTHDEWIMPIQRARLSLHGRPYLDRVLHVRSPGYKDEFSEQNGWAVEKGMPPKPKGALWLRFWMEYARRNGVSGRTLRFEVREAQ
jgi:predicted phosphodiesterase